MRRRLAAVASGIFAAVVSNHSLEHIANFAAALHEIGRVVRPDGSLFVAVPDAATFTDKLYRWLARGGGHINAFTAPDALAKEIERATGLPHRVPGALFSLSFLNRRHNPGRRPRRLLLLGAGSEWSLFLYAWLSRRLDRFFKTRTSVYGWAFISQDRGNHRHEDLGQRVHEMRKRIFLVLLN